MASEKLDGGRVVPKRNRYQAYTKTVNKKSYYLGAYEKKEDAVEAVCKWAKLLAEGTSAAKAAFDIKNLIPTYTPPHDAPIRSRLAKEIGARK